MKDVIEIYSNLDMAGFIQTCTDTLGRNACSAWNFTLAGEREKLFDDHDKFTIRLNCYEKRRHDEDGEPSEEPEQCKEKKIDDDLLREEYGKLERGYDDLLDDYVLQADVYRGLLERVIDDLTKRRDRFRQSQSRDEYLKADGIEEQLRDMRSRLDSLDDVLDKIKKESDKVLIPSGRRYAYTLAMIRPLRAVVAVVRGEDPAPAIVELATVLQGAIVDYCEEQPRKCPVPVTTQNLQRAFAVVSALASYGASYRGIDSGEEVSEELQKQRAEERKKALETVIDAFTDRSQRGDDPVISIGASLALSGQLVFPNGGDGDYKYFVKRNFISLPMGLAYQRLPGSDGWDFHFMLTFIDLAQYLTVSKEKAAGSTGTDASDEMKAPKPELVTALNLGFELGFLFGRPSFPVAVTMRGAWIPRVTYEDESRSEYRAGISVGVFVPFLDLN